MQFCYVDESGDTGAYDATNPLSQPVLILTGLFCRQEQLSELTRDVMMLKKRFFPNRKNIAPHWHDWLRVEVKGSDLRRVLREDAANEQRRVLRFMDQVLRLLERRCVQIASRIYIKTLLPEFDGTSVYASAVQKLVMAFDQRLKDAQEKGLMVLDSRNKPKNVRVSHSVFTMNFKSGGSEYDRLAELPLFGHSECHAIIQLADWLSSAFLFPMATYTYYPELIGKTVHVDAKYVAVREKFGQRLKALQYRYSLEPGGRKYGGITVLADSAKIQRTAIFGRVAEA